VVELVEILVKNKKIECIARPEGECPTG